MRKIFRKNETKLLTLGSGGKLEHVRQGCASALPHDGDRVWVATEELDVPSRPVQRENEILQPVVARGNAVFGRQKSC